MNCRRQVVARCQWLYVVKGENMDSRKKRNNMVKALPVLLALLLSVLCAVAVLADGATVYNSYCASCHRLGTYDTTGSAPDLLGKGSAVGGKYTAAASGHKGITLTAADINDLKSFLDNPSSPGAALTITTSTLPNGAIGTAYSQTLSASGGAPPYTWSYSGTLPPGTGMTSAGTITGTPSASGTFTITARVADSKSVAITRALSIIIAAAASTPMSSGDKNLFTTNCASCHTPYGLQSRTASQIKSAISSNDHGMGTQKLKSLTSAEIDGIARSLVPSTPPSTDCSACHTSTTPSPSPSPSPAPSTGQTVYDGKCAGCHSLGTYDSTGNPDLSGKGSAVGSKYAAGVSGHKGITLSATDISNVQAFLNAH
jgi:mono/diheme cytochrome c family protein